MKGQETRHDRNPGRKLVDMERTTPGAKLVGTSVVALVGILLAAPFERAEAQAGDPLHFGLGYSANAPESMAGGMAYVIFPRLGGIGLFVDAKFDIDSPSDNTAFVDGITAEDIQNDPEHSQTRFLRREASWKSTNVGVIRPLNPALFLYAGAGYAWGTQYFQYDQQVGEVGRALWVVAPHEDETGVNFMVGGMLRMSSLLTSQFGFETKPSGVTVGMSLRLPPW
jgi:hypothetical protein